jgi:hemolysin III
VPAQNRELRRYSDTERLVDAQVYFLGIAGSVGGCAWLVSRMSAGATTEQIVALAVYAFALVSMPVTSALYNMARPGRIKSMLRRLDHSVIFVMIAGTYTPFAAGVSFCNWRAAPGDSMGARGDRGWAKGHPSLQQ